LVRQLRWGCSKQMHEQRKQGARRLSAWLGYDPGILPTQSPPAPGESMEFHVDGLPPYKDLHFSIRNPRHKMHDRFVKLRRAAIAAAQGRAAYRGAISLSVIVEAPGLDRGRSLHDYVSGIMDTLDGSHGVSFTHLPIVYEDDCQVASVASRYMRRKCASYRTKVLFL